MKFIYALAGIVFILFLFLSFKEPQAERMWVPELFRTSTALIEDGVAVISNVRDFTYDEYEERWLPYIEVPIEQVERAWFMLEPFGEWDRVGHTYVTFELTDGRAYSFSVEARKEVGETYSAFLGLFKKYELSYLWGTEEDLLSRRVLLLDHEVYMYPLALEPDAAQELFVALVKETQVLAEKPKFYNTLTANCTNMLAKIVNRNLGQTIPYDISWNLPGLSDRFLYRIGLIEGEGDFRELRERHKVSEYVKEADGVVSESLRVQLGY